jgi:hypothetical protein
LEKFIRLARKKFVYLKTKRIPKFRDTPTKTRCLEYRLSGMARPIKKTLPVRNNNKKTKR